MKIVAFSADPGNHRFIIPIIEQWEKQGHEVVLINNYTPTKADVYWFDFADNNVIAASNEFAEDLVAKKVIVRLHAVEAYLDFYSKINWNVIDHLIFVSDHIRRKVCENYQFPDNLKIHTIHNGIDLNKWTFKEREKGFNLAYLGNIVPAKGLLTFLHYLEFLVWHDKRYKIYLAGLNRLHGREGEYFEHYLKRTGLKDHWIEEPEVANVDKWLDEKDINFLIQPSLAESFSLVVGEAMAKGIKPIINNYWGSEEIWPKDLIYSGFHDFVEIIEGSYNSKTYRDYIKRYSLDDTMKQISEIL